MAGERPGLGASWREVWALTSRGRGLAGHAALPVSAGGSRRRRVLVPTESAHVAPRGRVLAAVTARFAGTCVDEDLVA